MIIHAEVRSWTLGRPSLDDLLSFLMDQTRNQSTSGMTPTGSRTVENSLDQPTTQNILSIYLQPLLINPAKIQQGGLIRQARAFLQRLPIEIEKLGGGR